MGISSDVTEHYMKCTICQQAKLPKPAKAPLMSLPVGSPWEMLQLAVDVLEVPLPTNGNRYSLAETQGISSLQSLRILRKVHINDGMMNLW